MVDVTGHYAKPIGKVFTVWEASREEMISLGKKWLGDELFHEVISWPLENARPDPDGVWRIGDIAIFEGAENKEFLVEHGLKHLLGDHHD